MLIITINNNLCTIVRCQSPMEETQALGGSKIVLANERNKVVKFSTGKCVCPEDEATPRLTTGRQQQVTRKSSVWKSEDCYSHLYL